MSKDDHPALRSPEEAGAALESQLGGFSGELTVADAAARSGLPLRDAETALKALVARYDGHLAATSSGELLFRFPGGLVRPRDQRALVRAAQAVGGALAGVGRFMVRAWVCVAAIGYTLLFAAVLIAIAVRSERGEGIGNVLLILFHILFEALWWTFHPFSPFRSNALSAGASRRQLPGSSEEDEGVPFYEKVNRFVFGPPKAEIDPLEGRRRLIAEIRHLNGRVGIGDVMRVTGLARGEADASIARLLLDLDGDVEVTEEGAIVYTFADLRRTAALGPGTDLARPLPHYANSAELAPITGNTGGANLMFGALNGFNLVASGWALSQGLTLERLVWLFEQGSSGALAAAGSGPSGVAIVLGMIPMLFSIVLFLLPATRVLRQRRARIHVERENGRRALASLVLEHSEPSYPLEAIEATYAAGAGRPGSDAEISAAVGALGGSYDLDDAGVPVYRFENLAVEQSALAQLRAAAGDDERDAGEVVFSSDDESKKLALPGG